MKLHRQILTKNDCYRAGKFITVKGLMLHSTGANNPYLSRYVQPNDDILGKNKYANDWNRPNIAKCVHAFIGKDTNGAIRTYQTLPWNYRSWHAGGKANDTHISVEICEDGLNDREYFNAVYKEAVKLFAYLAKLHNLQYWNIIDHSEGRAQGIASNHGDVMHWFPKHGKSMKQFRLDVKALMEKGSIPAQPNPIPKETEAQRINRLATETLAGKHGNGEARKKSLGADYAAVQKEINRRLK